MDQQQTGIHCHSFSSFCRYRHICCHEGSAKKKIVFLFPPAQTFLIKNFEDIQATISEFGCLFYMELT
jgi:hypothetical protein